MDDANLIRQAQCGDQTSLARLLQQYYLPVKKFLVTITFDRNLAEDLTQETMIRAIQCIRQFEGRARFSTWLFAIATRQYLDWLRWQKRERQLEMRTGTEFLLQQADLAPEVRRLMDQLQALPREVALPVILKHYYGYTYEEIAEWMEIPVGTVKSRIFNAVRTLRKGLDQDHA